MTQIGTHGAHLSQDGAGEKPSFTPNRWIINWSYVPVSSLQYSFPYSLFVFSACRDFIQLWVENFSLLQKMRPPKRSASNNWKSVAMFLALMQMRILSERNINGYLRPKGCTAKLLIFGWSELLCNCTWGVPAEWDTDLLLASLNNMESRATKWD